MFLSLPARAGYGYTIHLRIWILQPVFKCKQLALARRMLFGAYQPLVPLVWDGAATYRPQRPDVMGLGVCAADSAQRAQTDNAGLCMYRGVVQCPQVFRAGFRIRLLVRYNIIGLFKLDEPLLYRNVFPVEFLFRGIPIAPKVFGPEEGHFRFFEYSVFCYGNRPGSICKTKG